MMSVLDEYNFIIALVEMGGKVGVKEDPCGLKRLGQRGKNRCLNRVWGLG